MRHVYRIGKREYIGDLSGAGAALYGARWNPRGVELLYTSGSISLASLEFMVHNYHLLSGKDVVLAKIEIGSDAVVEEVNIEELPFDWNENSYLPLSTQEIGQAFLIRASGYILKVPSAIVPMEFNYLLNPNHMEHFKTRIVQVLDPFRLDNRLFHV